MADLKELAKATTTPAGGDSFSQTQTTTNKGSITPEIDIVGGGKELGEARLAGGAPQFLTSKGTAPPVASLAKPETPDISMDDFTADGATSPVQVAPAPPVSGTDVESIAKSTQASIDKQETPEQNGGLTGRMAEGDELSQRILGINEELLGKSAFEAEKREEFGITDLRSKQNDISARIQGYALEAQDLQNQLNLAEEQVLAESEGSNRTVGGISPIIASRRRNIALQQANVASKALTAQAQLYAVSGQLTSAKEAVQEAVNKKYGPLLEEKETAIENLDIIKNSPLYSEEEKDLADKRQVKLQKEMQEIEDKKDEEKAIFDIMVNAANEGVSNEIADKIRESKTKEEALGYALPYIGKANRAKMEADLKLTNARITSENLSQLKLTNELKAIDGKPMIDPSKYAFGSRDRTIAEILNSQGKDGKLTQSDRESIEQVQLALSGVESLSDQLFGEDAIATGPLSGNFQKIMTKIGQADNAKALNAQIIGLTPTVARGIFNEVGVLTDTDVARYQQTIPNITTNAEANALITAIMLDTLEGSLSNKLTTASRSGIDVSGFSDLYGDIIERTEGLKLQIGDVSQEEQDIFNNIVGQ